MTEQEFFTKLKDYILITEADHEYRMPIEMRRFKIKDIEKYFTNADFGLPEPTYDTKEYDTWTLPDDFHVAIDTTKSGSGGSVKGKKRF